VLEPDFNPYIFRYTIKFPAGMTHLTAVATRADYLGADYADSYSVAFTHEDGSVSYEMYQDHRPVPPGRFPAEFNMSVDVTANVVSVKYPIIIESGGERNYYYVTWVRD
jgi:hypothetical protein